MRVNCLAQEHNTMSPESEPLDLEARALSPTLFLGRHHITPRRNDRVHQKIRSIATLNTYHDRGFRSNEANSKES